MGPELADYILHDAPHGRPWWVDYLFARFAWFRRRCGGHWERWYIDIVHDDIWMQVEHCSRGTQQRPPCAFGTPECEDW